MIRFLGVSDRVQCAFCAGTLGNLEVGDNIKVLHRQYFQYCRMAKSKGVDIFLLQNGRKQGVCILIL